MGYVKEMKDYFAGFIGQEKVKSQLALHLDGYKVNKFLSPIGLISSKGTGKSSLMLKIAENLTGQNGKPKQLLNLNCSSVKNLGTFVDQIIHPYQNTEVTFAFDEIHLLPKEVISFLLSVITPNRERKSSCFYSGIQYSFDFHQLSFLSASTNPEKLPSPFLSRLERIDLDEYKDSELVDILKQATPRIDYQNDIEKEIVSVCRSTPREVIKVSDRIIQWCDIKHNQTFNGRDWLELRKRANINYLGINATELKHLRFLKQHGELTLTSLASKLRLDRHTVQANIETFLLEKSLIAIDVKRRLTTKGKEVLMKVEENA